MSEKLKQAYGEAEDRMASMMQDMHEQGDLRHLYVPELEPDAFGEALRRRSWWTMLRRARPN